MALRSNCGEGILSYDMRVAVADFGPAFTATPVYDEYSRLTSNREYPDQSLADSRISVRVNSDSGHTVVGDSVLWRYELSILLPDGLEVGKICVNASSVIPDRIDFKATGCNIPDPMQVLLGARSAA